MFDVVVSAVGLFTRPVMPDLVEEESFTGTLTHTARWDHSVDLTGKRVAVLGTGSTAAQLIPEVAKVAERVYSVQRSPTWVLPKPDRPYSEREKWAFRNIPFAKKIYRTRLWLRSESNISVIENGSDKTQEFRGIALKVLEATIRDDELRRKLTPDHPLGCKRLVFASDYLQTLTQPHVEVVASPARTLRARTLVTEDGTELDVDVVRLRDGLRRRGLPGSDRRSRRERGGRCAKPGATGRTPTWAWRFRGSRTSSCCTGPTPMSDPTA